VRHRLGLETRTQISVCKSPFPSAGPAVSLFRAKTVQQRPLLPREVIIINDSIYPAVSKASRTGNKVLENG